MRRDVMAEARLDAILLARRYTLLEQGALDTLPLACAASDNAVVIGGPYNSGILATGTMVDRPHDNYALAPPAIVTRVAGIEAVAARHHVVLAAAALQFPLAHPSVASVIPGVGEPTRVAQTIARIQADFWAELKAKGLLRDDAPVPVDATDAT